MGAESLRLDGIRLSHYPSNPSLSMRILQVSPCFPPSGGVEYHVKELADGLSKERPPGDCGFIVRSWNNDFISFSIDAFMFPFM